MRRTIAAMSLIVTVLTLSCFRRAGIIPKDDMSSIYYDIYITDNLIESRGKFRRMADTARVYEPIFNRYGYTTDDYLKSVDYYMEHPDRYLKILEETKRRLEVYKVRLEHRLEAETKSRKEWSLPDSLEIYTADSVSTSNYYRYLRMLLFKADSTVYLSPVADSAFAKPIPMNPFQIFPDSVFNSDRNFVFYKTMGLRFDRPVRHRPVDESGIPSLHATYPSTTIKNNRIIRQGQK